MSISIKAQLYAVEEEEEDDDVSEVRLWSRSGPVFGPRAAN